MFEIAMNSEIISIKGELVINMWNAELFPTYEPIKKAEMLGLKPLKSIRRRNLVVTAGKNFIADLLIAAQTASFTHCGVGSGTNAPAAGDVDLQTAISPRKTITDRYRSNNIAKFDTFFSSADNTGTWNEAGLFTALTGGTMLSRALISPAITKDSSKTVTISWQITVG